MYSERKNIQTVDFLLQQDYLKFICTDSVVCLLCIKFNKYKTNTEPNLAAVTQVCNPSSCRKFSHT